MKVLEKTTIIQVINQLRSEYNGIEVVDYTTPQKHPFVNGTCYYNGIILYDDIFRFHYSIFSKLFSIFFSIHSMKKSEYIFWRSLMELCLIKKFSITLRTYNDSLKSLEVESGHYLSMKFDLMDDNSTIEQISCYDEINFYSAKHTCYVDLLECFIFPLLNYEFKDFGMTFSSVDDLTDANFVILSALSI